MLDSFSSMKKYIRSSFLELKLFRCWNRDQRSTRIVAAQKCNPARGHGAKPVVTRTIKILLSLWWCSQKNLKTWIRSVIMKVKTDGNKVVWQVGEGCKWHFGYQDNTEDLFSGTIDIIHIQWSLLKQVMFLGASLCVLLYFSLAFARWIIIYFSDTSNFKL